MIPREDNWIVHVPDARLRDEQAWRALIGRFQLPLFTFVAELVGDREVALEIVQESLLNATRYIGSLKDDARFDSWLFSIGRQKVQQHWRKMGKERQLNEALEGLLMDQDIDCEGPDETLIADEDREGFLELLDSLPEAMREVLLLHYLEDFSVSRIAVILDLPEGTVKSRLYHSRLKLRSLISSTQAT